jgi:hypothetical protein
MRHKRTGTGRFFSDERGIALAMVLVLSAVTLGIMAGLIYMVTIGTQTSGMQKRYKTAYEANLGGIDIMHEIIEIPGVLTGERGDETAINDFIADLDNPAYTTPNTCVPDTSNAVENCTGHFNYDATFTRLETKLYMPQECWTGCNDLHPIDIDDDSTYDITFELGQAPDPVYSVYAKIIDTTSGNSGIFSTLAKGRGVVSSKGEVIIPQIVYLYTIEVLAQAKDNPLERAKSAVLLAY